jgi:hypothetical protein
MQSPGNNQVAIEVFHNLSQAQPLKEEVCVYVEEWDKPYLHPPGPLLHTMDLVVHRGATVCTCIEGLIDTVRLGLSKQIMWYIYNPHDFSLYDQQDLIDLMGRDDIIKVARMPDQRDLIRKMFEGAKIEEATMEAFNVELALKLLKQHSNTKRKLPV